MRRQFKTPDIEILRFNTEDILTASGVVVANTITQNASSFKVKSTVNSNQEIAVNAEKIYSWIE